MEMSQSCPGCSPMLDKMPLHTLLKQVSGAGGEVASMAKEPAQSYLVDPAFGSMAGDFVSPVP